MCGLRTRPRTDVDPPRFLDRTAIGVGAYRLAALGAIPWFRSGQVSSGAVNEALQFAHKRRTPVPERVDKAVSGLRSER